MGALLDDANLRFNISRADLERTGDTDSLAVVDGFIQKSRATLADLETKATAVYADRGRSDQGKRDAEAELRAAAEPGYNTWASLQHAQVEAQYTAAVAQLDAKLPQPSELVIQQLAATLPSLSETERFDLYLTADDERRIAMEALSKKLGPVATRRADTNGGTRVVWSPVVDLESDQVREFQRARRKAADPVLYGRIERLEKLRAKLDAITRDTRKLIRDGRVR